MAGSATSIDRNSQMEYGPRTGTMANPLELKRGLRRCLPHQNASACRPFTSCQTTNTKVMNKKQFNPQTLLAYKAVQQGHSSPPLHTHTYTQAAALHMVGKSAHCCEQGPRVISAQTHLRKIAPGHQCAVYTNAENTSTHTG